MIKTENRLIIKRLFFHLIIFLFCASSAVEAGVKPIGQPISPLNQIDGLPELTLRFSPGDMRHFAHLNDLVNKQKDYKEYNLRNSFRKVPLEFDGRVFNAKIKMHGRSPTQHSYGGFLNSFTIKLSKGDSILGLRKFKLYVSNRLQYGMPSIYVARKFGVLTQTVKPVIVNVPLFRSAHFVLSASFDDKWIELEGFGAYRIFEEKRRKGDNDEHNISAFVYGAEGARHDKGDIEELMEKFSLAITEKDLDINVKNEIIRHHRALNNAVFDNQVHLATDFFDVEYITDFMISLIVSGEIGHLLIPGNLRAYYDLSSGRFFPVVTHDAATQIGHQIKLDGLNPSERVDSWSRKVTMWASENRRIPLLSFLFQNDEIRLRLFDKIIQTQPEHILKNAKNELNLKYLDWHGTDFTKNIHDAQSFVLYQNIEAFSQYEEGVLALTFLGSSISPSSVIGVSKQECGEKKASIQKNMLASVKRNSKPVFLIDCFEQTDIAVDSQNVKLFSKFGLNKDQSDKRNFRTVKIQPLQHSLYLPGKHLQGMNFVQIFHQGKVIELQLTQSQDKKMAQNFVGKKQKSIKTFLLEHENLGSLENGVFVFHTGSLHVDKDMLFPVGLGATIDGGTNLSLGPDISIIVRGNLRILGTQSDPVYINSSSNNFDFGVIASIGTSKTEVFASNLIIRGASEVVRNGSVLSGGLSFYRHKRVHLDNISLLDVNGEDGLNIKDTEICVLKNIIVSNPLSDGIDVDNCNGELKNVTVQGSESLTRGNDGIDFSFSEMMLEKVIISGFMDKGISIGEKSKITINSAELASNTIGMAVKDGSCAFVHKANFINNKTNVAVYRKKGHFASATAIFNKKIENYDVDEDGLLITSHEEGKC